MSKAVKSVTGIAKGILGGGIGESMTAAKINKTPFKIANEAKRLQGYINPMVQQQMARQGNTSQAFDQANVAQALAQSASGKGPSLAEAQMKATQDRNLAQIMAAQSAARGAGGGAGARNLANAMTMGNRGVAQDVASARLAEQRQAQQDLIGLRQTEDAQASALAQDAFNADIAAKRELQQAELQQFQGEQQRNMAVGQARAQRSQAIMGAIGGAASAGLMSDKNEKTDIKSESQKIDKFLESIKARSYEYKNPDKEGSSKGKKFGIMAQDLEKSEVGKTMVQEKEGTKMVDIPSSMSAILASQARIAERLSELEKGKKKKG